MEPGRAPCSRAARISRQSGTTNDYIDAWFSGFQPAWSPSLGGLDQPKKLGRGDRFGRALPIWMNYMARR